MVYDLPLEEVKVKPHQITTLHLLCALSFTGTGAIIAVYNYTIPVWAALALLIAGVALAVVTIAKNKWVVSNKVTPVLRIAELIVSLSLAGLSVAEWWKFPMGIFGVLSVALLFALYWERSTDRALFIHLDTDGVKLPVTARKRFITWPEVEQVVLRFGTLSINCADNRLIQYTVGDDKVDSEIFEAFCSAQVENNREKRIKDDW